MDSNIISALGGAVIGFIGGAFKPLISWEIEKRRTKRTERKDFIDSLRTEITRPEFNITDFIKTDLYAKLRPHLSGDLIKQLETRITVINIVVGHRRQGPDIDLLNEIATLEKQWRLY